MSDFLKHLAARSLGHLPVVRPRLPSLFEPSAPGSGPPSTLAASLAAAARSRMNEGGSDDAAGADAAGRDHQSASAARDASPRREETDGAAHAVRMEARAQGRPAVTVRVRTAPGEASAYPHQPASASPPRRAETHLPNGPQSGASLPRDANPARDSLTEPPPAPSATGIALRGNDDLATRHTLEPRSDATSEDDARRQEVAEQEAEARAARAAMAESVARSIREALARGGESSRRSGSDEARSVTSGGRAPTVRVEIGRIEVRALMSPAAAPRHDAAQPPPSSAAPSLSLEEYLKQRRLGGPKR
jgi:hypothetical protein